MPPRWPRQPDRRDPDYRRLADRMNFAVHVGIFAATNSGFWFFQLLQAEVWPWILWLTGVWSTILLVHGVYVFGIANYSNPGKISSTPAGQDRKSEDASKESIKR